ncbi:hypothetical protein C8Q75DRAFT_754322 [Abortiporus biennis]|nr:hypothetical protein C8Q75DRAFT_754322 [Abortiporus biennis]
MVQQNWSAPERRLGDRLFSPLPFEIYLMILDEIYYEPTQHSFQAYKAILCNIALVCRFFATIASQKLYKRFVFDGGAVDDDYDNDIPQGRWLNELQREDEDACALAKYVREMSLQNWRDQHNKANWRSDFAHDRFLKVIPSFTGLNTFSVSRTPLAFELLDAIFNIPALKVFRIKDCIMEILDNLVEFSNISPPSLVEVEVWSAENFQYYRRAFAKLAATPCLRQLKTTHWKFAGAVIKTGIHIPLTTLDVPVVAKDATLLSEFLNRTPTITDLLLSAEPSTQPDTPQVQLDIHPMSLSNLKTLRCPSYLLSTIFPNRPIHSLDLVEGQDWLWPQAYEDVEIDILKEHTPNHLQRIDMSISMYHSVKLKDFVPKIDTLCICLPFIVSSMPCQSVVRAVCSMQNENPITRRLIIKFFGGINIMWSFNLEFQEQLIFDTIIKSFPSVTSICMTDGLEWVLYPETDKWELEIQNPQFFRSLLRCEDEGFWQLAKLKDPHKRFASLFAEEELVGDLAHKLGLCDCQDSGDETVDGVRTDSADEEEDLEF